MAGKKVPSIADELARFKDMITKNNFEVIRYQNHTMYAISPKGSLIIEPEDLLWGEIIEDDELKSIMSELDMSNDADRFIADKFAYCGVGNYPWLEVDGDKIYNGSIIVCCYQR